MPDDGGWTVVTTRRTSKVPVFSFRAPAPPFDSHHSSQALHGWGAWAGSRTERERGRGRGRGRGRREEARATTPTSGADQQDDEARILLRMQRSMERVEASEFFKRFLEQVRSLHVAGKLYRAASMPFEAFPPHPSNPKADLSSSILGFNGDLHREGKDGQHTFTRFSECTETLPADGAYSQKKEQQWQLQIVVYGLGHIADSEVSRCQLALILLLKSNSTWVGDLEVYDPVLSPSECKVIQALGCSPIPINEEGRRTIDRPTMFYMPHCEDWLYDNVLHANWTLQKLSQLVILGNSFKEYEERWSSYFGAKSKPPPTHVLEFQRNAHEIPLEATSYLELPAFNNLSWHFFAGVPNRWLEGGS